MASFLDDSFSDYDDDDDDDDVDKTKSVACPICGGREYHQEAGAFVCSNCHTQSQTNFEQVHAAEDDAQFDWDGETGAFNARRLRRRRLAGGRRARRDPRVPLPSLRDCVRAHQTRLKEAARAAGRSAGVDEASLLERVRVYHAEWTRSWAAAAEHYADSIEKEGFWDVPRFSLRDHFLGNNTASRVSAFLERRCEARLRAEGEPVKVDPLGSKDDDKAKKNSSGGRGSDQRMSFSSSTDDSSSSDDAESRPSNEPDNEKKEEDDDVDYDSDIFPPPPPPPKKNNNNKKPRPRLLGRAYRRKRFPDLRVLLDHTDDAERRRTIGRFEAALRLRPDAAFLAAACHRALFDLRAGVAAGHLHRWTLEGRFPTAATTRRRADALSTNARPTRLPTPAEIECASELLRVASGTGDHDPKVSDLVRDPDANVADLAARGRIVGLVDNAPLMAARFVTDLGLCRRVLDVTYALMGLNEDERERTITKKSLFDHLLRHKESNQDNVDWLPPRLELGRPEYLTHPVQVLALVLVACKMIPGWETWTFKDPQYDDYQGENDHDNPKQSQSTTSRFPYSDDGLRLLTNGRSLKAYLDRFEHTFHRMLDQTSRENTGHFKTECADVLKRVQRAVKGRPEPSLAKKEEEGKEPLPRLLPNTLVARPPPPPLVRPLSVPSVDLRKDLDDLARFLRLRTDPREFSRVQHYKVDRSTHGPFCWSEVDDRTFPTFGILLERAAEYYSTPPSVIARCVGRFEAELERSGTCAIYRDDAVPTLGTWDGRAVARTHDVFEFDAARRQYGRQRELRDAARAFRRAKERRGGAGRTDPHRFV